MTSSATSPPTAALSPSSSPTVRAFRIDVIGGPDQGAGYVSDGERGVVGTHRSAELVLTDRTVSRFHCELSIDGDGVVLRDLGSRNGTILDSVEVQQVRLRGPAIVDLGRTQLRIDLLRETIAIELAPQERFGRLIGVSPAMRALFARLQKLAHSGSNVLLEGEPGTGKDAAAEALHEQGGRREGPLEVVDGSGPALEVEAELFGTQQGGGALERCHGGTLVLDDVGSLTRGTQRALARSLGAGRVRRPGASDERELDLRIVSISRRDLRIDVNADRFRADLYHLLAPIRLRLPPLRDHPADIPLLVSTFLAAIGAADSPRAAQLVAPESIERLRAAPWPGNVRELRAFVERAVAADESPGPDAPADDLPLIDGTVPLRDARRRWVRYFERAYLADLLARADGNVAKAARNAGVDRVHLHRLIARARRRRG